MFKEEEEAVAYYLKERVLCHKITSRLADICQGSDFSEHFRKEADRRNFTGFFREGFQGA